MAVVKRRDIEVAIGSLRLLVAGSVKMPSESRHAVTAELVWPRNGTPSKRYTRIVRLHQNACEFKASDWADAILFKDAVEGRFALKLTVSQALSDSAAGGFAGAPALGRLAKYGCSSGSASMPLKYSIT